MIFYTVLQFFTPSKLQDEMRREDFYTFAPLKCRLYMIILPEGRIIYI
jgi:hypothetical protein